MHPDRTPDQIVHMALQFTRAASQALSFLELPSKTDGEMFEGLMDQVADNLPLYEAAWDLFSATAREDFFGSDASTEDRKRWVRLADDARAELDRSYAAERAADEADYRRDLARDERLMAGEA
jgi:hypothetical protein